VILRAAQRQRAPQPWWRGGAAGLNPTRAAARWRTRCRRRIATGEARIAMRGRPS